MPEAALAACVSASARTLHLGPPLPEPAEMQEMIGATVEIAGGREMGPLAMAARLLFLDPRRTVILAIDDAHTLSHRSLSYLAEMTELLAPDEPILQVVLAGEPSLLDTLAQPEFETFRNRLCRPQFETFQPPYEAEADEELSQPPDASPIAASPMIARKHNRPVAGFIVRLAALGICYFAFDVPLSSTLPIIPSPISASLKKSLAGSEFSQWLGRLRQRRNEETIHAPAVVPQGTVPAGEADATHPTIVAKSTPPAPPAEIPAPPMEPSTQQRGAAGGALPADASPSAASPALSSADKDQFSARPVAKFPNVEETKAVSYAAALSSYPAAQRQAGGEVHHPDDLAMRAASPAREGIRQPAERPQDGSPTGTTESIWRQVGHITHPALEPDGDQGDAVQAASPPSGISPVSPSAVEDQKSARPVANFPNVAEHKAAGRRRVSRSR